MPLLSCALLLGGCTTVITPPKTNFAGYTAREKIHFKLALNVTDELRRTQWEQKDWAGDATIIPAGKAVADNAPVLARQIFTDVVDINNGILPPNPVDGALTPKLVNSGFTLGKTSFSQSLVSLTVEWTLTDPAGNVIWADTVTGAGVGKTGGSSPEYKFKLALEDVLKKSQRRIWSARAIRQFAMTKYPDVKFVDAPNVISDPKVSELCTTLESTDPDEVGRALKALRTMDAPEAVPAILPCLENNNVHVVRDACRTLAVLGNKSVIPSIEPLLTNSRKDVRKDAQDAIKKLQEK
jgi:hypothetical protein